jgi:hypothetical protein
LSPGRREGLDAGLLVGVPEGLLMGLLILPGPQGLLELLLVQPDLAGQVRQHVDLPDVPPLDKESLQDPVVILVALAVFPGVLVALGRQVRVPLGAAERTVR